MNLESTYKMKYSCKFVKNKLFSDENLSFS